MSAAASARPTRSRQAVIADDDEFFRLALASILVNQLGFGRVIEGSSLDEAFEHLDPASRSPDLTLALFDLSMPGMAGAASLSAIRDCYPDIKVVVVSASRSRGDVLGALAAGVHGYISKDAGPQGLVRALRLVLDGEVAVPSFLAEIPAGPREIVRLGRVAEGRGTLPGAAIPDAHVFTPRQREVMALLVEGLSNKEIARRLKVGEGTVKVHVASVLRGFGVPNRAAAAAAAARFRADEASLQAAGAAS